MNSVAKWEDLPKLAVYFVLDNLYEAIDRTRFGAVCTDWHRITKEYNEQKKKQLPMLMTYAASNEKLYSISEGKIYSIHLCLPDEICIGSCYGWLAFANHKTFVIRLVNPFKNSTTIVLPPLEFYRTDRGGSSFKIKKVILSADPLVSSDNDYVIVVIFGGDGTLTFFKPGLNKWGKIDMREEGYGCFTDVIFYKNIFYSVSNFSMVISFDLNGVIGCDKPVEMKILQYGDDERVPRVYLVESSKGDLLLVQRDFVKHSVESGKFRKTNSIKVYKLVFHDTNEEIIISNAMTSLDGDALFVGFNHSCSVSTSEFSKCKPNSIYFTNDFY